MKTQVTFRHMKSSPELHDEAIEAAKKFNKYYDGITTADIIFNNDNETSKVVEFTVRVNGHTLVSQVDSDDFQKSLTDSADKIVRQLRKLKDKNSN